MILLRKRPNSFRPCTVRLFRSLAGLVLLFALSAVTGHAQAPKGTLPPHQAIATWVNGVDPAGTTITGSNVYRCGGTCTATSGSFVLMTATPLAPTVLTYTDTNNVIANGTYSWCVTNLVTIPTGPFETPCSNIVTLTIPKDGGVSPTGLVISAQ